MTPIRKVRDAHSDVDESPPRALLPITKVPDPLAFCFNRVLDHVDTRPLDEALESTVAHVQNTFSTTISELVEEQLVLIKKIQATDAHVKGVLQVTNSRVRKTEKEAEMLASSAKLSVLSETCFDEISKIMKLFAEVDMLLPVNERIQEHSGHYPALSQCILRLNKPPPANPKWKTTKAASPAMFSLRSIQESSPAESSAASLRTLRSVVPPHVPPAPLPPESTVEAGPPESAAAQAPPRLRLAPRKSKSNLRVPQIRTVPPLPSTRLDTVLPNVERDNFSTRSSIASRASVFSTFSQFFLGPAGRRTAHEASNLGPGPNTSAEDRLRKISGSSTGRQSRTVSAASRP